MDVNGNKLSAARGPRKAAKPGVRTTEGLLAVIAMALPWFFDSIPKEHAAVVSTIVSGVYSVARTIVKILGETADPQK